MPRTTVDIEAPVLQELKAIQQQEHLPLGKLVSQLLAEALTSRQIVSEPYKLQWISRPLHAIVDIADKDALYQVLDQPDKP
jgi:hypothetical protein